jgi:hypothetical protein
MARKNKLRGGMQQRALSAVENGHLSAEEILDKALGGRANFRRWLERHLEEVRGAPPRKPHVRRIHSLPEEVIHRAVQVAHKRFEGSDVRHICWGVKRKAGRTTAKDAVILLVDEKKPLKKRDANYLPPSISFSFQSENYRVATDVRAYAAYGAKQSLHAGNRCEVKASGMGGTLGAVVTDGQGQGVALLSGHVAKQKGVSVSAHTDTGDDVELGTVLACRDDAQVDAALAGPLVDSLLPFLAQRPTVFRDLPISSPRERLDLLLRGGTVEAFVEAVEEPANFSSVPGARPMEGLIRLDRMCTKEGDSGAPAVDSDGRIVGFVIGYAGTTPNGVKYTYLMPARRAYEGLR